jgi:hypothetical protein
MKTDPEYLYLPRCFAVIWSLKTAARDVSKPCPAPKKLPLTDKQAHDNYVKKTGGL